MQQKTRRFWGCTCGPQCYVQRVQRAWMLLVAMVVTGCEDPVDPGQIAREERPPEAEPPLVLDTQKPAPAPRLRETRSLGYAGDQPLTQVAPRPSMFAQERTGQPRIVGQPYYYYGGYPQGRGRASAPQPAQPVGTSNLIWSTPSTPSGTGGGLGGGALGGPSGYGSPAGSPLGPR